MPSRFAPCPKQLSAPVNFFLCSWPCCLPLRRKNRPGRQQRKEEPRLRNFYPARPQRPRVRSVELLEYPPQNRTRLSPPLEKDEMIQSPFQQTLQLRDCLVKVAVQLVEDSKGRARQPTEGPFEPKTLALTRQSWPTSGNRLLLIGRRPRKRGTRVHSPKSNEQHTVAHPREQRSPTSEGSSGLRRLYGSAEEQHGLYLQNSQEGNYSQITKKISF